MVYKAKPTDKQYNKLLEDADTRSWYEGLEKENTKESYLRQLHYYLKEETLSIDNFISEFENSYDKAIKRLKKHINQMKARNRPPKSISLRFAAISSRLLANRIKIDKKLEQIKFGNTRLTPTIEDEEHLTHEQLRKLIEISPLKVKAMECLVAFAGMRPGTAVDLELKDLPEIQVQDGKVILPPKKRPTFIKVRAELSKYGLPYLALLGIKGCEIMVEYLQYRLNNEEKLTPSSKLIAGIESGTKRYRRTAYSNLISQYIQKLVDIGMLQKRQRPYILRGYFDMALLNSSIKQEYQSFLMGHSGTIEQVYTLRKHLQESTTEEMRKMVKEKVEPWLWRGEENGKSVVKNAFVRLAQEMGLEVKEDIPMEDTISEIAQVYKAAKEDLTKRTNNGKQKVVREDELEKFLERGWELVNILHNEKVVIKNVSSL